MVVLSKITFVTATLLFLSASLFIRGSQKEERSARWVVDRDDKFGAIHSKTTEALLISIYGQKNVTRGPLDVGEGETMPATILLADLPQQRIEIAWKDEPMRKLPARIQIQGGKSLWRTKQGITLGTSLKILEKLNGGSFTLSGFGWDYSGTVTSWNKGLLEESMKNVVVRLAPSVRNEGPSPGEESVEGDVDFSSSHPVMQRLNPTVYQVIWLFEQR